MKHEPVLIEFNAAAGGEIRYYTDGHTFRYVCAVGEGSGFETLMDAQADALDMIDEVQAEASRE